ncbi:MAG: hypothetical protein UW75_C0007G0007 [Parcubacteria group bacterium GW2011_GWF2_44_8]|nr:MAG: hypothetical protein UW75_C0007G0007 [Parcubacteria group bacterium GW2011_GWF2_44_8]
MLLAVILFIAWPARIWGNFASMIVDASEENLNRKGSTAGGFEAE